MHDDLIRPFALLAVAALAAGTAGSAPPQRLSRGGEDVVSRTQTVRATRPATTAQRDDTTLATAQGRQAPVGRLPAARITAWRAFAPAAETSDPLLPQQWHLERIRWPEARQSFGEDGVGTVVAVLDTGVRFRADPPCTAGAAAEAGLDLAETRFVPGHDFVDDDATPLDQGYELLGDDPGGNPFLFGHGTFVAGLIAAGTDNGYGGAGVAPGVSIMPLRVVDRDGNAPLPRLAAAIRFAAENGADVIHVSVAAAEGSDELAAAVREAHSAGAVVVAPAGLVQLNRDCGADQTCYPAAYPEVIAVAGTDPADAASFSASADYLDLAAPGSWSPESECFWGDTVETETCDGILAASFIDEPSFGETTCAFFRGAGVGFAAAQVSAAAALLEASGVVDPDAVRSLLQESARDLGPPGFDRQTGHGLLDLHGALGGEDRDPERIPFLRPPLPPYYGPATVE